MGSLSGKEPGRVFRRWCSTEHALCMVVLLALAAGPGAQAQTKKPSNPADSVVAKEIVAREIAFQKDEIDFNYAALEKLMTPEYFELSQSFMNREQVFATLRRVSELGCRFPPATMRDARVTFLSPEVATLVYRATLAGACYGRTFSVDGNISALWVRRDGRWQVEMRSKLVAGS